MLSRELSDFSAEAATAVENLVLKRPPRISVASKIRCDVGFPPFSAIQPRAGNGSSCPIAVIEGATRREDDRT